MKAVTKVQTGAYSEVGKLREVLVHRPDLSLQRLTPDNCQALLFDDVLWVKKARQEHDVFVDTMRERNVHVHDQGEMLAEVLAIPKGRAWLLDHRVNQTTVGTDLVDEMRGWLDENLPGLVERLVQEEIQRMSHRARKRWDDDQT